MADQKRRIFRIYLDRRHVDRQIGFPSAEEKPGDAVHANTSRGVKPQTDPGRVFTRPERIRLALNFERAHVGSDLMPNSERDAQWTTVLDKLIIRTG